MIRIIRGPVPEFLLSNRVLDAQQKLILDFENSERQQRLQFDTRISKKVKQDVIDMCKGKCSYCETRVVSKNSGDLDNFRPKAGARGLNKGEYAPNHYWWLAYEWENMLLSCDVCNRKFKRDRFPVEDESRRAPIGSLGEELRKENALLIDPSAENPEEHIEFEDTGIVKDKTTKGSVTIKILGLDRDELVMNRKLAADKFYAMLNELPKKQVSSKSSFTKGMDYINELISDHPTQEYVAVQRAVLRKWSASEASKGQISELKKNDMLSILKSGDHIPESHDKEEVKKMDDQLSSIKRFSIKSVEIENFKNIEKLHLEILPSRDESGRESWLLMLGDNGIGKSSVIQAIALALAGKTQLSKLELNPRDFLRRGSKAGKVTIQSYEQDKPIVLEISPNELRTDLNEVATFILAYGSTRLLPKGSVKPDKNKEQFLNIRNLFDYSVALEDPSKWLSSLDENEFNSKVAPAFFDVLDLKENERLWVGQGEVKIHQFGADHTLKDNSDGYKSVTALVADMMQTLSIDEANYHSSQGIVLIDEIGNHLHPRWKMKIVGALREAFPNLQFIVTTHEPLCLRGLLHGEVVVMVRDEKNSIRALDYKILPDHNTMQIDQLLTSDLFGLINIMDEDTEKTYEEYYELLSKQEQDKTPEDEERIKELTSLLADKELLGSTPMLQSIYELVNKSFAEKLRKDGFKTKTELKKETIDEVNEILKTKKIDWL